MRLFVGLIVRLLGWALAVVLLVVVLYVGVAGALMLLPANDDWQPAGATRLVDATGDASDRSGRIVEAYVLDNGVHTDLLLPVRGPIIDWARVFSPQDFIRPPLEAEFIAIGWGDEAFYLNTPTWADLTPGRALGALLGRNPSLLHVTYVRRSQLAGARSAGALWRVPLTTAQYERLVRFVRTSVQGAAARASVIEGAHYGDDDAFYRAEGRYGPLDTCNAWTGRALRQAGVKASRWTPFDFNVTHYLERAPP